MALLIDEVNDVLGLVDLGRVGILDSSVEAASEAKGERDDDSDEHRLKIKRCSSRQSRPIDSRKFRHCR